MSFLNFLRRAFVRFVEKAQGFSQAAANAAEQRRRQPALDALEAERLDRLRNPSKYLGKW